MNIIVLKKFPSVYTDSIILKIKDKNYIYNVEEDLLYNVPNIDTASKSEINDAYEKAYRRQDVANKEDLEICLFDLGNAFFLVEENAAAFIDLETKNIITGNVNISTANDEKNPTAFISNDIKNGLHVPTDYQTVKIKCWAKENKGGEQ